VAGLQQMALVALRLNCCVSRLRVRESNQGDMMMKTYQVLLPLLALLVFLDVSPGPAQPF
jgi:hypothetical protein